MAQIHHNGLRVNAVVPDETVDIWREQGWSTGLHKDSDPDDHSPAPVVLPAAEPEPPPPAKAKAKADTKET
jgi:hypothetical protein